MPPLLKDLGRDLFRALEQDDPAKVASIRRTIAEHYGERKVGAEAHYKLGLYALFKEGNLNEAVMRFRSAAKAKQPEWSAMARVSLGLVLSRQGKFQQALFELRKVAAEEPRGMPAAQALGYIVLLLREEKKPAEAERTKGEQERLLTELASKAQGEEQAVALYLLGMEQKLDGERDRARKSLLAARAHPDLPDTFRDRAAFVLQEL